jgi:hypothetical protein
VTFTGIIPHFGADRANLSAKEDKEDIVVVSVFFRLWR